MAITGQKFKFYPEELKKEVVRLHVVEGWAYRRVNEHLDRTHLQGRSNRAASKRLLILK